MSVSIRYEAQLFFMSLCTGAGLVVVYDCVRIFRLLCPHKMWIVGVEDLAYEQNDGNLRGFCIGGVILAMIIYQNLISCRVLKYLQNRIEWIKMRIKKHRNRARQEKR